MSSSLHFPANRLVPACLWLCFISIGNVFPIADVAVGDDKPILRTTLNGPIDQVSDIAFSPDGERLYAASWDKQVHVWKKVNQKFEYSPSESYRVPIHGGLDGALSAVAISDDGLWIAMGGRGARLDTSGVKDEGFIWPGSALSSSQRLAEGVIYVFNTQTRDAVRLEGHAGTVTALEFVPSGNASNGTSSAPTLVSLADVELGTNFGEEFGPEIRVWDVASQQSIFETLQIPSIRQQLGIQPPSQNAVPQLFVSQESNVSQPLQIGICFPFDNEAGLFVWTPATNRWARLTNNQDWIALAGGRSLTGKLEISAVNRRTGQCSIGSITVPTAGNAVASIQFQPQVNLPNRTLAYAIDHIPGSLQATVALAGQFGTDNPQYSVVAKTSRSPSLQNVPVWRGHPKNPILTASSDGDVAVVDSTGQRISVMQMSSQGELSQPFQLLAASQVRFQSAEFVRRGDDVGLRISDTSRGPIVFELTTGKITNDQNNWQRYSASAQSRTELTPESLTSDKLTLRTGGQTKDLSLCRFNDRPVRILTTATTDQVALVAWLEGAEPRFDLYDLETGELRRRMRGVEGRIVSIDVLGDQRLLAVGTDSGAIHVFQLGEVSPSDHGLIRNGNQILSVHSQDGDIVFQKPFANFEVGERVEAVEVSGERVSLDSVDEFYELVHLFPPGMSFELITDRQQSPVEVGDAIKEKKPLFSLLIVPSQTNPNKLDWIGWHPVGVFESSRREAETFLGWHFNTSDADSVARFAEISEYRERFHRPGLIRALFENEQIPQRQPPPPAQLSLELRTSEGNTVPPNEKGIWLIRDKNVTAILRVRSPFPVEAIGSVNAQLEFSSGTKLPGTIVQSGVREWTIQFPTEGWMSGIANLNANVISREYSPRVFKDSIPVRYQVPAPVLVLAPTPETTDQPEVDLMFNLQTNQAGQSQVTITRIDGLGSQQTVVNKPFDQGLHTIPITLEEGLNRIEIVATNEDPQDSQPSADRATVATIIEFKKPVSTIPPSVTLKELLTDQSVIDLGPRVGSISVQSSEITLSGEVNADTELNSVILRTPKSETKTGEFEAGVSRSAKFEQKVQLTPGENEIVIEGTTTTGLTGRSILVVNYTPIPSVPVIEAVQGVPLDGQFDISEEQDAPTGRLVLNSDDHSQAVSVTFRPEASTTEKTHAETYRVTLNGETVQPTNVAIDGDRTRLTIPLNPGSQRLSLVIENEWGGSQESDPVVIDYRRPPKISEVILTENETEPFLRSLKAMFQTPEELPVRESGVQVLVNGVLIRGMDVSLMNIDRDTWAAEVRGVSLIPDSSNSIELSLLNEDGRSRTPWKEIVVTPPEQVPPPVVTVLSPETETQTSESEVVVRFRVQTESEVNDVIAVNDIYQIDGTVSYDAEKKEYQATIPLLDSVNEIRLAAIDQDGQQSEPIRLVVTRIPRPTLIRIDSVGDLAVSAPVKESVSLDKPTTQIHGHVELDSPMDSPMLVRVWLNDFLQEIAPLVQSEDNESLWTFSAPITLNRNSNALRLELLGGPSDQNSTRELTIDCANPITEQSLHVVMLTTEEETPTLEDSERLISRMRESLSITCLDGECSSPSFSVVREYPLTGRALQVSTLNGLFSLISAEIDQGRGRIGMDQSVTNDVVLIFYAGQEYRFLDENRFVLATGGRSQLIGKGDPEQIRSELDSLISSELFVDWMGQLKGAHLLFLDVESNVTQNEDRDETDPHLGVYRVTRDSTRQVETSQLLRTLSQLTPTTRYLEDVSAGLSMITTSWYTPAGLSRMEFGAGEKTQID
ncbi:hypothetical protein AB1L42_16495 [Thalassoglobus sp. JC818]|uniref:WD40 repeat domain-containing protein n=1 Tax=Thalassoglobus sp. JC818 TaxID=3232136 RepID=UPI0034574DA1